MTPGSSVGAQLIFSLVFSLCLPIVSRDICPVCPFLSPWGTMSIPCDLPPSLHPLSWHAGRVQRQAQGTQQEHQSPPSSSEPSTVLLLRFVHSTSLLSCPSTFPIHISPSLPSILPSHPSFIFPSSPSSLLPSHPSFLPYPCMLSALCVAWMWDGGRLGTPSPCRLDPLSQQGDAQGPTSTSSGDGGAPDPGYRLSCPRLVLCLIQAWHCSLVGFHCRARSGPLLQPLGALPWPWLTPRGGKGWSAAPQTPNSASSWPSRVSPASVQGFPPWVHLQLGG